jgi:AMP nucleosidase
MDKEAKITIAPIKNGFMTTKKFRDVDAALDWLMEIYDNNTEYLRRSFEAFSKGNIFSTRVRACYPFVEVTNKKIPSFDKSKSFGFLSSPGVYSSTLTRPSLFREYYKEQFNNILDANKEVEIYIGVSDTPIPLHFALGENFYLEADLSEEQLASLPNIFDMPNLNIMDDEIPDGVKVIKHGNKKPLALFNAPRVDLSLQRLRHYTGTNAEHFQKFVVFTNYQFYIDEFIKLGHRIMSLAEDEKSRKYREQYTSFVEPGNYVLYNENLYPGKGPDGVYAMRMPQMPAYHLTRADGTGITMVNIGIGPSNAKTITDHIAVLRPSVWLMLGHCAGLRNSQKLGDYVLAHAYVREDNVLDVAVPLEVPIPALSEVQKALEEAFSEITGLSEKERKNILRTGTVATVSDRNWELWPQTFLLQKIGQCRAIALDMESATIAANGFRFRVPYGTLLCVSDKPLHGQLKLPGMADTFYRQRVDQHLDIGLRAMEKLRSIGNNELHSRKLRSFDEVAFR